MQVITQACCLLRNVSEPQLLAVCLVHLALHAVFSIVCICEWQNAKQCTKAGIVSCIAYAFLNCLTLAHMGHEVQVPQAATSRGTESTRPDSATGQTALALIHSFMLLYCLLAISPLIEKYVMYIEAQCVGLPPKQSLGTDMSMDYTGFVTEEAAPLLHWMHNRKAFGPRAWDALQSVLQSLHAAESTGVVWHCDSSAADI